MVKRWKSWQFSNKNERKGTRRNVIPTTLLVRIESLRWYLLFLQCLLTFSRDQGSRPKFAFINNPWLYWFRNLSILQNLNNTFTKSTTFPFKISTFSLLSILIFLSTVLPDVFPPKPPMLPSDLTTRWHGTFGAYGFRRHALPTALYALVFNFFAISP